MVRSSKRLAVNWLLVLLAIAGLAFALWPRPAAHSAPGTAKEQTMSKTFNVSATLPPIDVAAPQQYKTATFAVG